MSFFESLISGINNYFENSLKEREEKRRLELEKRIRKTTPQSKFIGNFQWKGDPDDISSFTVVYCADNTVYRTENLAILKDSIGKIYLFVESLKRKEVDYYNSILDQNGTEVTYSVISRDIFETTSRSAIDRLQGSRSIKEERLIDLYKELEEITEQRERKLAEENKNRQSQAKQQKHHAKQNRQKESSEKNRRSSNENSRDYRPRRSIGLSIEDALEILNLSTDADADADAIKRAYRQQAQRFHPDKASGSSFFMKQINEARDLLLRKMG